jgi:hypothetical protein
MYPALLVDVDRQMTDHPVRLPMPHGRRFSFAYGGVLMTSERWPITLDVTMDGVIDFGGARGELGANIVGPEGRSWRIDPCNELVIDPRRHDRFVIFNCRCDTALARIWRAFGIQDDERKLLDVMRHSDGRIETLPSSAGVPLELIINTTVEQKAWVENGIARTMIMPLLRAELDDEMITAEDIVVTWDGDVLVMRTQDPRSVDEWHQLDYGISQAMYLTGHQSYDDDELYGVGETWEILRAEPSPKSEIAAVVRNLFPRPWQIEHEMREQLMLLDVESLPQL